MMMTFAVGENERMIGVIEIDEKDVSDDKHIILEFPIEPERNGMQTVMRVKTNIKFYDWFCPNGERRTDE